MMCNLSKKSKEKEAADMVREWAMYWFSDENIGERDGALDKDPEGLKLVVRVFEHLSGQESLMTDKS
jgi:hypothetical protein